MTSRSRNLVKRDNRAAAALEFVDRIAAIATEDERPDAELYDFDAHKALDELILEARKMVAENG